MNIQESFLQQGYWVAKKLILREQLDGIAREIDRFCANEFRIPWITGTEEYPDDLNAVHFPHRVSKPIFELALSPGLVDLAKVFCSAHLRIPAEDVALIQSMLYVKRPEAKGQPWHQDERFTPTMDRSLVTVWIAIDPATVENGCVNVLPGSHLKGMLYQTSFLGHDNPEWVRSEEIPGVAGPAIPLELEPGDVAFFSGYIIHGSFRNRSNALRRSIVLNYKSAQSPVITEIVSQVGEYVDLFSSSKGNQLLANGAMAFSSSRQGVFAR